MEKTIIAALLMLISLTSYAQGLMWTAKAELNMSSMSNVEESKMHPGFYAGIGAGYVIDETRSQNNFTNFSRPTSAILCPAR